MRDKYLFLNSRESFQKPMQIWRCGEPVLGYSGPPKSKAPKLQIWMLAKWIVAALIGVFKFYMCCEFAMSRNESFGDTLHK